MSRRKVLAIISQDPILKDAASRMKVREDQLNQKIDFIKKQIDNAINERRTGDESDEGLIEARLKEIGALTSYNKDTHHLCVKHDAGSIDLHENHSGHPLEALFNHLRGQD